MVKSVTALILACGGSKRIHKKNIISFFGNPIISYPIKAAIGSGMVDEVVVSTDDEEILKVAKSYGAKDHPLRPPEYCGDTVPMDKAIRYELEENIISEVIILLYSTAVFVTRYVLGSAFLKFIDEELDHLISVKKATEKSSYTLLVNEKRKEVKRKYLFEGLEDHSYDKEYHSADQFEIFYRDRYLKSGDFYGKTGVWEYNPHEVVTINNWEDYNEALLKYKQKYIDT